MTDQPPKRPMWHRLRLRRRSGWFVIETAAALTVLTFLVGAMVVASRDWADSTVTNVTNERAASLLAAALAPAALNDCVPVSSNEVCDTFLGPGGVDDPDDDVHVPDGPDVCPYSADSTKPTSTRRQIVPWMGPFPHVCAYPPGTVFPPTGLDENDLCPDEPVNETGYTQTMSERMARDSVDVVYCVYVYDRYEFGNIASVVPSGTRVTEAECRGNPGVEDVSVMPVFAVRDVTVVAYQVDNAEFPTRLDGTESLRLSESTHSWTSIWLGDLIEHGEYVASRDYDDSPRSFGETHFGTSYNHLVTGVPLRFGNVVWVSRALPDKTAAQRAELLNTVTVEANPQNVVDTKRHNQWTNFAATRVHAGWSPGTVPDVCIPAAAPSSSSSGGGFRDIVGVLWAYYDTADDDHKWGCGMWLTRPGWNPPPQHAADIHSPPAAGSRQTPGGCTT